MKEQIVKFLRDEEGLTTVEYAVAGALITIAVVTAFTDLGAAVATTIGEITAAVMARPA
jgi:pilus assembly protein Flp/PilA